MTLKKPGDLKKEGEELKALFAKVKKKQHNCAVLMAKDGIVVETHIKKSPEVLLKLAKKAGGMPKGAWGTMTMDGQVIIIDPINDKIPGNLTKLAKKFFSDRGLKFRLEIKEPEEEGRSAAPQEQAPVEQSPNASDESQDDVSKGQEDPGQKLVDQLAAVQKQIDALLADGQSVMHSALVDALQTHERAMGEEKFDRAVDTMRRIEVALEDYAAILAKKLPLQDRMDALAGDIEKLKSSENTVAADEVTTAIRGFERALRQREWDSATVFLDQIKTHINSFTGQNPEDETDGFDETPETQSSETTEEAADDFDPVKAKSDLVKRFANIKADLGQLLKAGGSDAAKQAREMAVAFGKQIKAADFDAARDAIESLEKLVKEATSSPEKSARLSRIAKMKKGLGALLSELR
ncbi:MAG: hypothetical protein L3J33_11390 [Rhodobacteraceae bacterium]|nr:hypothetical protein [Paracoccaceae bacterium]